MTTTRNELIEDVQAELHELIASSNINVHNIWFGDIDPADIQAPAVHFMLTSTERNENQVIQTPSRIEWNLNYDVSCLYGGSEAGQTFENARVFVEAVNNLLQTQHTADERLNNTCQDIQCMSTEYGYVALDLPEPVMMSGGVIKLIIQVIEIF